MFDIAPLSSDTISFDYGSSDVAVLAQKYQAILRPQSVDDIGSEYADLKYIVRHKLKQGTISAFSDMAAATLKCEELKDVSQLVDICGTFQASSADCERGFSLMNRIKTSSRNRLQVEHLDPLMRIKSRLQAEGASATTDLDKVYNQWRTEKDRRENKVTYYLLMRYVLVLLSNCPSLIRNYHLITAILLILTIKLYLIFHTAMTVSRL